VVNNPPVFYASSGLQLHRQGVLCHQAPSVGGVQSTRRSQAAHWETVEPNISPFAFRYAVIGYDKIDFLAIINIKHNRAQSK
jgi:hypothetical protein